MGQARKRGTFEERKAAGILDEQQRKTERALAAIRPVSRDPRHHRNGLCSPPQPEL